MKFQILLLLLLQPTLATKKNKQCNNNPTSTCSTTNNTPSNTTSTQFYTPPSTTSTKTTTSKTTTSTTSSSTPIRPHIVMALFDDLGANDLGIFSGGIHTPRTPFMDELMTGGIKLKQYYVQPICSPTRSALFTGRYPMRMGAQHGVALTKDPTWIPKEEVLLSERLSQVGYRVVGTGKWHLGHGNLGYTPTGRGFDEFYGSYTAAQDHWEHITWIGGGGDRDASRRSQHRGRTTGIPSAVNAMPRPKINVVDQHHDIKHRKSGRIVRDLITSDNMTHSTDVFAREAIRMIFQHNDAIDGPLFLYLPFTAPHWPNQYYQHYADLNTHIPGQKRQEFAGMITHLDDAMRHIVDALRRKKMWHNTLVIAYGDNGGDIQTGASNWPYRGSKASPWEGGTRVAAFIHSPNPLLIPIHKRGSSSNTLAHVTDWFPTILKMAGYVGNPAKEGYPLDGVDMWQSLIDGVYSPGNGQRNEMLYMLDTFLPPGNNQPEKALKQTAQVFIDCTALRVGDFKLIEGYPGRSDWYGEDPSLAWPVDFVYGYDATDYEAIQLSKGGKIGDGGQYEMMGSNAQTRTKYKLRDVSKLKKRWLFNLKTDPYETKDVQFDFPEKVNELLARINVLKAEQVPIFESSRTPLGSYFSKKGARSGGKTRSLPGVKVAVNSADGLIPVQDLFEFVGDHEVRLNGLPTTFIDLNVARDLMKKQQAEDGFRSKM